MDINKLKRRLPLEFEDLFIKYNGEERYINKGGVNTLCNHNIIRSQNGTHHFIVISEEEIGNCATVDRESEIARMEWMTFKESRVAYLSWIKVRQDYWREGIGSTIRLWAISSIKRSVITTIYSQPYTNEGKKLAKSQNFTKVDEINSQKDFYSLDV